MKFSISSKTSGADLGFYEGETAFDAANAMAVDAGYSSYRDMCSITDPDDLDAEVEKQMADLYIAEVQ